MKEQIEKAAKKYAYNTCPDENGWTYSVEREEIGRIYIAGANFANQVWEERTRWKSTSEDIPYDKWLIVKNADTYAAARVTGKIDLKFIRANFTHFKEII